MMLASRNMWVRVVPVQLMRILASLMLLLNLGVILVILWYHLDKKTTRASVSNFTLVMPSSSMMVNPLYIAHISVAKLESASIFPWNPRSHSPLLFQNMPAKSAFLSASYQLPSVFILILPNTFCTQLLVNTIPRKAVTNSFLIHRTMRRRK